MQHAVLVHVHSRHPDREAVGIVIEHSFPLVFTSVVVSHTPFVCRIAGGRCEDVVCAMSQVFALKMGGGSFVFPLCSAVSLTSPPPPCPALSAPPLSPVMLEAEPQNKAGKQMRGRAWCGIPAAWRTVQRYWINGARSLFIWVVCVCVCFFFFFFCLFYCFFYYYYYYISFFFSFSPFSGLLKRSTRPLTRHPSVSPRRRTQGYHYYPLSHRHGRCLYGALLSLLLGCVRPMGRWFRPFMLILCAFNGGTCHFLACFFPHL